MQNYMQSSRPKFNLCFDVPSSWILSWEARFARAWKYETGDPSKDNTELRRKFEILVQKKTDRDNKGK